MAKKAPRKKAKMKKAAAKKSTRMQTTAKKSTAKRTTAKRLAAKKTKSAKTTAKKLGAKKGAKGAMRGARSKMGTGRLNGPPQIDDVKTKDYEKNKKHASVKITGDNLIDAVPTFKTTTPSGITWTLENVDHTNKKHMFVDATPNSARKSRKDLESGDLIITINSSTGGDTEQFPVNFTP